MVFNIVSTSYKLEQKAVRPIETGLVLWSYYELVQANMDFSNYSGVYSVLYSRQAELDCAEDRIKLRHVVGMRINNLGEIDVLDVS